MSSDQRFVDKADDPGGYLGLLDLERYPVHRPDDPTLRKVIIRARQDLVHDGCARIEGFIRDDKRGLLADETTLLAPEALHSRERYTPYGSGPDDSFPIGHPRRRSHRTTSGSVTRDLIPTDTAIQQLYCGYAFQAFVAACLETDEVYQFADPMRGLIINTMEGGNSLGWHFDANEFVVSLMTRRAEDGGMFQYCPNIRQPGDERYDAVKSVLDGTSSLVRKLDLQIGDLQIFKGRYSIHRVDPILSGTRHTVIFGYAREPGFIGSVDSTMKVYGRVMQAHFDAENRRHNDGLAD